MLVFRRTNRITGPVSKTVAVKTTSYELLSDVQTLLEVLSSLFRGQCRSKRQVVSRKLREKRQTRKANRDSSFSLSQLRVCVFDGGLGKFSQFFHVLDVQSVF